MPEAARSMTHRPGPWQMGRSAINSFNIERLCRGGIDNAIHWRASIDFFETALLHISQAKNVKPKHTIIREGRQMP